MTLILVNINADKNSSSVYDDFVLLNYQIKLNLKIQGIVLPIEYMYSVTQTVRYKMLHKLTHNSNVT